MANFTAALNILGTDWHVTLCYGPCVKAGKARVTYNTGQMQFHAVEYWESCDLTVGIVSSPFCDERAKYWADLGYTYPLGYKPHATLGKGDLRGKFSYIVGQVYTLGEEYIRVH